MNVKGIVGQNTKFTSEQKALMWIIFNELKENRQDYQLHDMYLSYLP
jgi:hypothetical protein